MLNLSSLSRREIIYLTELFKNSGIAPGCSINYETLAALKPNVLESALSLVSARLTERKMKFLKNIINKIVYPALVEGQILIPKSHRLN